MTDVEKLESYADWCILAAYFFGGLATGIVLMTGHPLRVGDPEGIAIVTIGVIGLALVGLYDYIWKKIRTIELMESQDTEGGSL